MFKNVLIPCHKQGQAIKVVDNKIMIICQCLTSEDLQRVRDFDIAQKEKTNV